MVQSILQGRQPLFFFFDEIAVAELGIKKFSCSTKIIFSYLFLFFQYFIILVMFLLSRHPKAFWILAVLFCSSFLLFFRFSFSVRLMFHCHIPLLYPNCMFLLSVLKYLVFCFFFANIFMSSIYIK